MKLAVFELSPCLLSAKQVRLRGLIETIKYSTNTRRQGDRLNYKRSGYNIVFDVRSHGFSYFMLIPSCSENG